MTWNNIPEDITLYEGFVYKITNLETNKYYIGKKLYWKTIRRPPLKGKKRKRVCRVESDWKTYNSSSAILQEEISKFDKKFVKQIVWNCKNKTDMALLETFEQICSYLNGDWSNMYNEMINLRIRIRK